MGGRGERTYDGRIIPDWYGVKEPAHGHINH